MNDAIFENLNLGTLFSWQGYGKGFELGLGCRILDMVFRILDISFNYFVWTFSFSYDILWHHAVFEF